MTDLEIFFMVWANVCAFAALYAAFAG